MHKGVKGIKERRAGNAEKRPAIVLIDNTIMKKDAVDYTRKLTEYINNK